MPVIKSAKKKLRQDKKREIANAKVKETFKELVKKAKAKPTEESIRLATQAIDKAVKHFIIHKNKAARMKSSLSKLMKGTAAPASAKATTGKPAKKATAGKKKTAKK